MANRECPTIGRIVDELEYRLPEEVERPDFADIKDEDDKIIARSMYLKKLEKNLNMSAEIDKEKPKLYALIEMNISERSEVEVKNAHITIPTVRQRNRYLCYWTLFRFISLLQPEIHWWIKMLRFKHITP